MRSKAIILLVVLFMVSGCGLGPGATPTVVPAQLSDQAQQQAALAAIDAYAKSVGYQYRNVSLSLLDNKPDQVIVHASVSFQTKSGFPWEDHDTLFTMRKSGSEWQADRIKTFPKLDWEVDLQRGPVTLKSAAGFVITIPANWAGYVAGASELTPASTCNIGMDPLTAVPVLVAIPAGYSSDNVPVVLRGYQQCPRAPGLSSVLSRLDNVRTTDKSLQFQKLDMTSLAGQSALLAVVTDPDSSTLYDYYVIYRERQLEFVLQAHVGQDINQLLSIINTLKFN